ncbi:hypothetical protein [Noviherbaspirillum saxi]|uniref:Uncharacterized protein n=1 Tax=Noviherbaspirillum saxi TaxID=2320863 RepID=A0A3A3FJE5_9BURK|nr:hypothetical protein [Noviherbaspirillum saxi]RJF95364.1 hypothetical protein D3871_18220 [Noviherbaspirillum saxi]
MQVAKLEEISAKLEQLRDELYRTSSAQDQPLDEHGRLVQLAKECDFMLPPRLTVANLTGTVERKLANIAVLLERARKHESLPDDAQAAAEQEYTLTDEDYAAHTHQQSAGDEKHDADRRH